MNETYILTGGNIGDRMQNLALARDEIAKQCGDITRQSSIYQTAAWGNESQPDFLNQVLLVKTDLPPESLLERLLQIEHNMGRVRDKKNDPRHIDLDILFYNDLVLHTATLQIPHPRLHLRRFVLVPLDEINPEMMHPVLNQSVAILLEKCPDPLNVKKFSL